jgi:signal transduction histidine kinase/ActR/RegA family two-component response regulator
VLVGPTSLRSLLARFTGAAFVLFVAAVTGGGVVMFRAWTSWEETVTERTALWVSTNLTRQARDIQEGAEERAYSDEAAAILHAPGDATAQRRLLAEEQSFLARRGFTLLAVYDRQRAPRFVWPSAAGVEPAPVIPDAVFDRMDAVGSVGGYLRLNGTVYRVGGTPLLADDGQRMGGYLVLGAPLTAAFLASLNEGLSLPLRLTLDTAVAAGTTARAVGDSLIFFDPLVDVLGVPVGSVRTAFDRRAEHAHFYWGVTFFLLVLVGGAGGSWLIWYVGRRLLVAPLLETARDIEAMRDSQEVRELRLDLPIAEWEVLRTAFNETVRSLLEFQRRYRDVFDRAADALFLLEPSTGRVIDANPATSALTGVDAAAIVGQTLAPDLVPDGPGQRVVRWRRPDGVTQTWGVAASTIAFDGGTWTLAAYRDLTGREAMAHAQKMEAVGSLAGGIAHDFNNLMGAVLTGVTAARALTAPGHPASTALDGIEHAGTRAAELTRQLLSFSRHDPMRLEPVDLGRAIDAVGAICARTFDPRIVIDAWTAADVPPVLGDAGEIEQALLNLCINARDAMPSGGSLRIECQRVFLDEAQARAAGVPHAGTHVEIAVIDTGTGMTEEVKARLFEPFFTTKDPGRGTGLGLALVYGLTRQLGGSITVTSAVDRGTRVRLLFRALADRAAPPSPAKTLLAPARTSSPTAARPVVLLVDDERALREMLRMVLDLSGFRVLEAADGTRALAQFGSHREEIRAILLDVQLPGELSGVETLARIRALDADIPVLLCTGFVREDDLARMRQMSVDDVLLKPVDINSLLARLEALCARERATSAS